MNLIEGQHFYFFQKWASDIASTFYVYGLAEILCRTSKINLWKAVFKIVYWCKSLVHTTIITIIYVSTQKAFDADLNMSLGTFLGHS